MSDDFDEFKKFFYSPQEDTISQQTKDLARMVMQHLHEADEEESSREEMRELINNALAKEGELSPVLSTPFTEEEVKLIREAAWEEREWENELFEKFERLENLEEFEGLEEFEDYMTKRNLLNSLDFWRMMGDSLMKAIELSEEEEREGEERAKRKEEQCANCELPSSEELTPELVTKELCVSLDDQGMSDIGMEGLAELEEPRMVFSMNFHVFSEYEPKEDKASNQEVDSQEASNQEGDNDEPD